MTMEQKVQYGFSDTSELGIKLYEALPLSPKTTTRIEVAKKLHISGSKLNSIIYGLPSNAPIFEDFEQIGRIK